MDTIFIEQLEVDAIIGVYDWERNILQRLVFDVFIDFDIKPAAKTDDVEETINYAEIAQLVSDIAVSGKYKLIETLAETICQRILSSFSVDKIKLKIAKPGAVPEAKSVGVVITRTRQ